MALGRFFVSLVLLLATGIYARENIDAIQAAIIQRLANVEDVQTAWVSTNKALETKINDLEKKNHILENELNKQNLENEQLKEQLKALAKAQEELISGALNGHLSNKTSSLHRRQTRESSVAFSTFLDHDYDNLGPDQVIVFNQVQLNEGNGYNKLTGAFTVPISGVYVFTFFIGERDTNQLYVKLVVNGVAKSDAVAETVSNSHDSQGGNVLVVKVDQGDVVMVEHNTWGSHIEGYPDIRLSTFSGFLLYPIESDPEVVGK